MTAEQERDSLDTIKAVLEMTEARGCSQAEASVARDKARELMRKYVEQSAQPPVPKAGGPPVSSAESYWDTHTPYYKGTSQAPFSDAFVKSSVFPRPNLHQWLRRQLIGAGILVGTIAVCVLLTSLGVLARPSRPVSSQVQPPVDHAGRPKDFQRTLEEAREDQRALPLNLRDRGL
jgi:hypothetical protein